MSIHQSGFHPHLYCDRALIKLVDTLVTNMDNGLIIDYHKAFDLVDHATLLTKLAIDGVSGR